MVRTAPSTSHDAVINEAISQAADVSLFIGAHLGQSAQLDRQERFAVALLSICLEHREAVLALVSLGARTSAFALLRPLFEAYVMGLWMKHLSSDQEIHAFMARGQLPSVDRVIARLRVALPEFGDMLNAVRTGWGGSLHDFTHGGKQQVARWVGSEGIGPRHSDVEAADALLFADAIGLQACMHRELICERSAEAFATKLATILALQRARMPAPPAALG